VIRGVREGRWQRQRLRAPRCPPGWSTAPPDFVGVGTHKSGTSWWYQLLSRHPGVVSRGHPKELDYFHQLGRACTADDASRYACWFPRPPGRQAGEWTPRYAEDLATPAQLAQAAPAAKLLFTVRDPVERYRSDVTMLRGRVDDPEASALERGRYATQLENVLRSFPAERVLLLQYEQCVADPRGELARTHRFLGLDDSHTPWWPGRGVHVTRTPKVPLPDAGSAALVAKFEPEVEGLRRHMPHLDLSLWPSVRHLG
jgi:hypothetical protein